MRSKLAKEIKRSAEAVTVGKPLVATKRLYRQMKKRYLHNKKFNNGKESSSPENSKPVL